MARTYSRTVRFPDGEVWRVSGSQERMGPRFTVLIEVPREGATPLTIAHLQGNPLDPMFLERFAAQAASRNGAAPAIYAERLTAIAQEIITAIPSSSPAPFRGAGDDDDVSVKGGLTPLSLAGLPSPPPRAWVIDGLLPAERIGLLFGTWGAIKSTLAAFIAVSVAAGLPFLGRATCQGRVLWLDYEEDAAETKRKVESVAQGLYLPSAPEGIDHLEMRDALVDVAPDLAHLCVERQYALVVLDSFGPALGGDPDAPETVIPTMESMRSVPTSWLCVDHEAKAQTLASALSRRTPFGSVYKGALARSLLSVVSPDATNYPGHVLLQHMKNSYGPPFPSTPLKAVWDSGRTFLEVCHWEEPPFTTLPSPVPQKAAPPPTALERVLTAVQAGASRVEDIVRRTKLAEGTVRNQLVTLTRDKAVARTTDGTYTPSAPMEDLT
ncbi:MAG: AAA family ATPase [Chloroflexi bacterium]|nr:AAA family ATPase [Chloroflexota bacterium]